jgi:hypothetical protein
MPEESNIFGMRVVVSEAVPPGTLRMVTQDELDAAAMAVAGARQIRDLEGTVRIYDTEGRECFVGRITRAPRLVEPERIPEGVRSRRIQVEAWASQQLYTNWGEGGVQVDPVRHARLDQMERRGQFKSERLTLGFSSGSDQSKFDGTERCDGCSGRYDLFNVAITELGFMCAVCRSS